MRHEPSGPADSRATLIRPEESSAASRRSRPWSMPPDLLADATKRLRASVLIYALGFFLAGLAPALVFTHAREMLFASPAFWLPPIASITGALGVAALITWTSFTDRAKLRIGLGFEVLGSFGIAAAEYQGIVAPIMGMHGMAGFGLSWVVTWVLLFSVVVPTPPILATIVAICSVAAVPVTYAAGVSFGSTSHSIPGLRNVERPARSPESDPFAPGAAFSAGSTAYSPLPSDSQRTACAAGSPARRVSTVTRSATMNEE